MNNIEFLKKIELRKEHLNYAKIYLKEKFIGIDNIIDKIIDDISLWYISPEIQFKPLIICLWGVTGVGKTDLVRSLVKLLNFSDKFIEIQMDVRENYKKNIEDYFDSSDIGMNEPSILLLDEIQRFRSKDEEGKMLEPEYYNDIWMLLSDGKFKNNSDLKNELTEMLMEELYWINYNEVNEANNTNNSNGETEKKKLIQLKYKMSSWSASRLKKKLKLNIPLDEIMLMDINEKIKLIESNINSGLINDGKSYEKLLIFISGNLDEAFNMSEDVEDVERDADIYNEMSKRITIIDIKNALQKKFKPEQIARFGNNHIIYPCLDKESYNKIIIKNCDIILNKIYDLHKIKISLSNEVYNVIYRNGVYPAQGVRPVISTVYNLLGSNLPYFMYHALINNVNSIKLDVVNSQLITSIGNHIITKDIYLEIDTIKNKKSIDEKMLVITHELGHALIYAVLFNTPPKQINVNGSGYSKGFVINHTSIDNKSYLKNRITIFLGGTVAEEIVFGEEYKTQGCSNDIIRATTIAANYVRQYGMDGTISYISKDTIAGCEVNYDVMQTNSVIENILDNEKKRAKDIINRNAKVFKNLIEFTIKYGKITPEDFTKICNENGMNLCILSDDKEIIYSYDDKLNNYLKS